MGRQSLSVWAYVELTEAGNHHNGDRDPGGTRHHSHSHQKERYSDSHSNPIDQLVNPPA